jgi:hypothetical protein
VLPVSRRDWLGAVASAIAAVLLPGTSRALAQDPERRRLEQWVSALRAEHLTSPGAPLGMAAARVGRFAAGTPYQPGTLEAYLREGGSPRAREPLTIALGHFDCVTLVESCLAVARTAFGDGTPTWERFGREIERMRYRSGERGNYATRLHYFSEWISDGASRGLVRDLGGELGGIDDDRPLRFMTAHWASYPALADDAVMAEIAGIERGLDGRARKVVPTDRIASVADRIETGDVLAFATAIPGLDVTHAAFAFRTDHGVLRVLHAPLSGGVVEVTRSTLPEYVGAIRRATGILVARPLWV